MLFFFKGCTQACRHGAVFRRKGCRVDRAVAPALRNLGLTSTGTVGSDSQTCISESVARVGGEGGDGGKALNARLSILSFPSLGLIVASALVDVSQQKPSDFKDKSQSLKSRKALPPAHQGTCVWATAPPPTGCSSLPSERPVELEAFHRHWQNTIWLLRLKFPPIRAHSPKVGQRSLLLRSPLSRRQVTSPQLRLRSSRYRGADPCTRLASMFAP